jgi:hypothetical protein
LVSDETLALPQPWVPASATINEDAKSLKVSASESLQIQMIYVFVEKDEWFPFQPLVDVGLLNTRYYKVTYYIG